MLLADMSLGTVSRHTADWSQSLTVVPIFNLNRSVQSLFENQKDQDIARQVSYKVACVDYNSNVTTI